MSNKLHEILAVESDKKNTAKKIYGETKTTFIKKDSHFEGLTKVYSAFEENGDQVPPEYKEIVDTVKSKLEYFSESQITALNATLTKEEANSSGLATATLTCGEKTFGEFSATSLLALENWLKGLRDLYMQIPTLDPTKKWNKGDDGIFVTDAEVKFRSVDKKQPMTLAEATDQHKAQVEIVSVPTQVGKYETTYKSGKVTPLMKSNSLGRIDELIVAVKEARAIANNAVVEQVKVAQTFFDWINKPLD